MKAIKTNHLFLLQENEGKGLLLFKLRERWIFKTKRKKKKKKKNASLKYKVLDVSKHHIEWLWHYGLQPQF